MHRQVIDPCAAPVLLEEVYLDPDEEDDLMADDVRDEDY